MSTSFEHIQLTGECHYAQSAPFRGLTYYGIILSSTGGSSPLRIVGARRTDLTHLQRLILRPSLDPQVDFALHIPQVPVSRLSSLREWDSRSGNAPLSTGVEELDRS